MTEETERPVDASALALVTAVEKTLEDWTRPSAIRLMAGEMTAQEMRTAQAVAKGLAARVRSTMAQSLKPPPSG